MDLPLRRMDGDPCARCVLPFEGQGALCPTCHDAVEAEAWGEEIQAINRGAFCAGAPGFGHWGFTVTDEDRAERAASLAAIRRDLTL